MRPIPFRPVLALALALLLAVPVVPAQQTLELTEPVVLRAAAVAETEQGLVGMTATITVTAARGGQGHIFLDTFPLAEVDMQGSARLAVRVASQVAGVPWETHDFFFVVRSSSPVIGGPSAGATLAVGAVAALSGWKVREDALMTGTINPDGSVGAVGGVPEKAAAARDAGMRLFLYPSTQQVATVNGRPVDMQSYCANSLGIECHPVLDVIDAVNLMTDHRIERPPAPTNVTNDDFRAVLGPLSAELRAEAAQLLDEAQVGVAALPPTTRASWEPPLAEARALLASAESAAANGTHYTSASLSFQASIQGHYIRDAARLLASQDPAATLDQLLQEARSTVANANATVLAARVTHASESETVGSAQVRLYEARQRLATAEALALAATDANGALQAVYEAAFAQERAGTAVWWLGLAEHMPPGAPVTASDLHEAARETISVAEEAVAYIDAVIRESAGPGAQSGAAARIADAKAMLEAGLPAGAILQALEAEVRAASILEVASAAGVVPEAKFEATRLAAARAIEAARARGVEPLLAQSQYEFGLTLQSPLERLTFLGLARVTANLAGLPSLLEGGSPARAESRFQGIPQFPGAPPSWIPAAFAVGLALGTGAGLTALMPKRDEEEDALLPTATSANDAQPPTATSADDARPPTATSADDAAR